LLKTKGFRLFVVVVAVLTLLEFCARWNPWHFMLLVIAALGYSLRCVYLKFLCRAACGRGVGTEEINDPQYRT